MDKASNALIERALVKVHERRGFTVLCRVLGRTYMKHKKDGRHVIVGENDRTGEIEVVRLS